MTRTEPSHLRLERTERVSDITTPAATIVTRMDGEVGTATWVATRLELDRAERGAAKGTLCYGSNMELEKEPISVEEALDVYWVDRSIAGRVPNYAGFHE